MLRSAALLLGASVALSSTALAQADWTQLSPATSPTPRAGMWGVTDGAVIYLFGGKPGPGVEYNDLWRFDGTSWTDITPATGPLPPGRDFYGAAYDLARGRIVLYGGRSSALATNLGDTWEYDVAAGTWTQLTPAASPGVRRWVAMAYDAARNETILFGGNDGSTYYNDTWRWDGTNWTLLTPANDPGVRARGFLSYDVTRGEMIYYGGRNGGGALDDTWKWDGTDWSQVSTASTPGGFFAYGVTYDMLRDRHVVFGGTPPGQLSTTWEFDGATWELRAASGPSGRTGPLVTYVPGLGKTFMFGGWSTSTAQLDDTWEYQTTTFATTASYGAGCTGSGGLLTLAASNAPWLGDTFSATATNLATGGLAFNVLGFSDTTWVGGNLPVALGLLHPAGGAGCSLLASNDSISLLVSSGGTATTTFSPPNASILAGMMIYQQVLELELSGSSLSSINASNGLALTLGAR